MRGDDPLVLRMELQVQADPDPPKFETTAPEARPTQAGTGALREERPTLDDHLPPIR